MAVKSTAFELNSAQTAELVSLLGSVVLSVKASVDELSSQVKYFQDESLIGGQSAEAVREGARLIEEATTAASAGAEGCEQAIKEVAEELDLAVDYAAKEADKAANELAAGVNKIKDTAKG